MTALEYIINQTGLTPYKFGKKYGISQIYRDMKNDTYSFKNVIDIAKKENIKQLQFQMYGCECVVEVG